MAMSSFSVNKSCVHRFCPTKRTAKILPEFYDWTASPSPRDRAGIPQKHAGRAANR